MNLLIKSPGEQPGVYPLVRRGRELKYLSFTIVELGGSLREHTFESGDEELVLDFYTGHMRVQADGLDICVGPGAMIYIPRDSKVRLTLVDAAARAVIAGAPGGPGLPQSVLTPAETNLVGKKNWARTVYATIAGNVEAAHLLVGETVNQPGGWSSCPPHKHDRMNPPAEVPMEEIYYFQVEPRQGFAFMRVYTDPDDPAPFDHAYPVEHGDTVLIPRGYHPVVAAPGYQLHYTWILAGEGRVYGAWAEDPRHKWISGIE